MHRDLSICDMDIKEIISLKYVLPDVSMEKLNQCLSEVSYPKGFHILETGKVEKNIFFLKRGIVRAYTLIGGKEITFWIGKEGATIVSMNGYVNDEPGYETMELMEDSDFYVLKRKKAVCGRLAYCKLGAPVCRNRTFGHRTTAYINAVCHCFRALSAVDGE